jgi:nitrogen fixation protein FixH
MNTAKPSFNPWPLGLGLAFALFIGGTLALIVFSSLHRSDLVTPDYYEQEVRYQSRIDQANRTHLFRGQIAVTFDTARHAIRIELPRGHARRSPHGSIHLYRPSAAELDRHIELQVDADGTQWVDAAGLRPGLWKVRVQWRVDEEDYFVDETLVLPPRRAA